MSHLPPNYKYSNLAKFLGQWQFKDFKLCNGFEKKLPLQYVKRLDSAHLQHEQKISQFLAPNGDAVAVTITINRL